MREIVTDVASFFSILSAIFAFWQAYQARKQKNEVEKIKDSLIKHFTVYTDTKLLYKIFSVRDELNKNRLKPFNNNPLMIGKKLNNSISGLLSDIRGQSIYDEANIKKAVNQSESIIKNLNAEDFSNQISDLVANLSDIARYIDTEQRRI